MIRNLIYHIYPTGNWLWNLEQLKPYFNLFNGQKVFAVARAKGLDSPDVVRKNLELGPGCYRMLVHDNDPDLGETATLFPLLRAVSTAPADSVTFYGHAKGVTHGDDEAVMRWTRMMYCHCLGRAKECERLLLRYACVGAFKRYGHFAHFPRESKWHYSGTFFWFRNADLFAKDWRRIPMMRYGTEGYLSTLFNESRAACIYGDRAQNLYTLPYTRQMEEDYEQYLEQTPKRHVAGAVHR